MTYLGFHFAFVLPPIVVLMLVQRRPLGGAPRGTALRTLGLITTLAFFYTILWDNYIVFRGVWSYGVGRVLGTIAYVPVEEYAFFILQPVLTGLFYFFLRGRDILTARRTFAPAHLRVAASLFMSAVTGVGVGLIVWGSERVLYLGLILAWCGPVLTGLMWMGIEKIWPERRLVLFAIAIPTLYLWIADRVALGLGIWSISERYSLGIDPLGLPIEEAVFFLVTNWMVVQGVAMLLPTKAAYP
ncbi:MAG: lycopene cyclase domain-containing protein [Bacteroidetes bacterium]|nr:lycopene cyclase domain-containing protein [Bacteroidota bacterium]